MRLTMIMLATSSALLCSASEAQSPASNAQPPTIECTDRQAIRIGDVVAVTLVSSNSGGPLSWSSTGSEVRLKTGQVQSVKILPDPPNGTGGLGACLKANDYVRLQRTIGNEPQPAYLIAAPDVVGSNDVLIGDYPPPNGAAQFFITKAGGPADSYIHRGDQFKIRGTARDWWLLVPAGAADGTKVALDQDPAKGSLWVINH